MKINLKDIDEEEGIRLDISSTHFNMNYNKTRQLEFLVIFFTNLMSKKDEKEIRCIITNVARMIKSKASCLKIPRDKGRYTKNDQGISYSRMIRVLDILEKEGYLNIYIGGVSTFAFDQAAEFESSITEFTTKFTNMFSTIDIVKALGNKVDAIVEIKDRRTKELINTQGISGVAKVRNTVEIFNTKLMESRISLKGIGLPDQNYKRGFLDNLETGGRFYNTAGSIQTMEAALRPFLQIDGEDLVDLDFKCMHANLLYEQIQADLPRDFDPYGIDLWEMNVDANAVDQFKKRHGKVSYDPSRNLVKVAVMIGLNAKKLGDASRALASKFGPDKKLWGTADEHKAKFYGLYEVDFRDVMKRVQEHNHLISDKFFSDCGVHLQYIDSEILEKVILETLAIDEVLLPWHDGLMVKRSIKDQVIRFMRKAWYDQMGSMNFCKIEEK